MKLNEEFVESISRLYIEKHKPSEFKQLIEEE